MITISGQITTVDGRNGSITVTDDEEATFEVSGLPLDQIQQLAPLIFERVTITITGDAAHG